MVEGRNLFFFVVLGLLFILASGMIGCGDSDSDVVDPTDRLPDGGTIDEGRCKDACDRVAECMKASSCDAEGNCEGDEPVSFRNDCRRKCDQSGNFDPEVLRCIETSGCEDIFDCGFER